MTDGRKNNVYAFPGVHESFHYDDSEGRMYVQRVQDVEPILEANKRAYNEIGRGGFKSETMNHKARIPLVCIEEWCRQKGVKYSEFMTDSDGKLLRRFLNDPDNRYFLTRPGKV